MLKIIRAALKTQMQTQAPMQEMENFHFLRLAFALAFLFHTCELGQHKPKCKHEVNTSASSAILEKTSTVLAYLTFLAFAFDV